MFQKEYDKNCFSFMMLKEEPGEDLIEEITSFAKDKKLFLFSATNFGKQKNVNRLWGEATTYFFGKKIEKNITLNDTLEYIREMAKSERIIWVFNNVENLFEKEDFEIIMKVFREMKTSDNMFIFVSKSATFYNSLMESKLGKFVSCETMKKQSGFFDFVLKEAITPEEKFKYFAVFGGEKEYTGKIDASKQLKDNVIDTFFKRDGFFYNEPERILKKELRETQVYNLILEAISNGAITLNDISEYLKMPTSICNKYTTVLSTLNIIEKYKPTFGKDSRKSRYRIANNALNFWYNFVPENESEIALGNGEKIYNKKMNEKFEGYLTTKFVDICKEYVYKLKKEGKIAIDIKENETWWNKENTIDIVAGSGLETIAADCYWREDIVGNEELSSLEKKAKDLDVIERQYFLFSKNGFTEDLKKTAKERQDIHLYSFDEMMLSNGKTEKSKKHVFFFSRNK